MQTLGTKITSALAAAAIVVIAAMMAGLGLTALAFLAMFGFVAIGIAILARPVLIWAERKAQQKAQEKAQDAVSEKVQQAA